MAEMKHLIQRIKTDLESALNYRVDYEHVNNVFSFRTFTYQYSVKDRSVLAGKSWIQKIVLKRAADFTRQEAKLLDDSTILFVVFYTPDDEPIPLIKQNLIHVQGKEDFFTADYKRIRQQILHALPVDNVDLVDHLQEPFLQDDELEALIAWMEYEEKTFASYSGRNKLLEYYPYSELLRP